MMSNVGSRSVNLQAEVAARIEKDCVKMKDLANQADLKFLVYLIEMVREEAASTFARVRVRSSMSTPSALE